MASWSQEDWEQRKKYLMRFAEPPDTPDSPSASLSSDKQMDIQGHHGESPLLSPIQERPESSPEPLSPVTDQDSPLFSRRTYRTSPLPELITEPEKKKRCHDYSNRFYDKLEIKMKKYYRNIFYGEQTDIGSSISEDNMSEDCDDERPKSREENDESETESGEENNDTSKGGGGNTFEAESEISDARSELANDTPDSPSASLSSDKQMDIQGHHGESPQRSERSSSSWAKLETVVVKAMVHQEESEQMRRQYLDISKDVNRPQENYVETQRPTDQQQQATATSSNSWAKLETAVVEAKAMVHSHQEDIFVDISEDVVCRPEEETQRPTDHVSATSSNSWAKIETAMVSYHSHQEPEQMSRQFVDISEDVVCRTKKDNVETQRPTPKIAHLSLEKLSESVSTVNNSAPKDISPQSFQPLMIGPGTEYTQESPTLGRKRLSVDHPIASTTQGSPILSWNSPSHISAKRKKYNPVLTNFQTQSSTCDAGNQCNINTQEWIARSNAAVQTDNISMGVSSQAIQLILLLLLILRVIIDFRVL